MLSRVGFSSARLASSRIAPMAYRAAGLSTTAARLASKEKEPVTMFDPYTNKTIVLSDPEHPELGDYKIPTPINYQKRDPYAKYDDQGNRRNKNEPMHPEQDLLDMWSTDKYDHVSLGTALKYNGIFFGSLFALGFTLWYFEWTPAKPAMIRSYPYNGLAAALGAGSDEDAHLYQARPDVTAEAECGILPDDEEVVKQKESYLQNNAKFIKIEAA